MDRFNIMEQLRIRITPSKKRGLLIPNPLQFFQSPWVFPSEFNPFVQSKRQTDAVITPVHLKRVIMEPDVFLQSLFELTVLGMAFRPAQRIACFVGGVAAAEEENHG